VCGALTLYQLHNLLLHEAYTNSQAYSDPLDLKDTISLTQVRELYSNITYAVTERKKTSSQPFNMAPFSKPDAVLKQAEGLVSVGQTHAALQSLTEMFSSKRFRSTPLASLEPIMLRFVELCVDMRRGRTAKEGLMQYKNIAQNTSVGSIEVVINKFVQLADAKVQDAQEKADKAVALTDVDDLEASETPESILLGAVSGDQSKDRTDRALVTPWLKFLWESYRTSLETLKNNARLEVIYQVRSSLSYNPSMSDSCTRAANRTTSL